VLWTFFEDNLVPAVPYVVYAFGSPRVGNQAFSEYYDRIVGPGNTWRVVNNADVVPQIPLEIMGYYHINTQVWYSPDFTNYKICLNAEDPTCADSVLVLSLPVGVLYHGSYLGYDLPEYCWL